MPAAPATKDPEKPISTRDSRDPKNPNPLDVSQDPKDWEFRFLEKFQIRFPALPTDARPPAKKMWLGGNESHLRVNTTFYVNTVRPVHSGTGFLGFSVNGQSSPSTPPTVHGVWTDGTQLMRHQIRSTITIPFPGGYQRAGTPISTIVPAKYIGTEAAFNTLGWGDLYAEIELWEAIAKNTTKPMKAGARP